ncbi:uncharacterized protein LOC111467725 isoform X2 [Cucurbita maxima]|uniref:Uncharacterized protein LOC111467725 isoform X2 n=1 Tax=Cucurbita maxima TaxID=3661 RepID=A0A6J1HV26_CUCMA|nr:uncharacterized protein LOC111467725 isoform X2 [Cucurbita maxima]
MCLQIPIKEAAAMGDRGKALEVYSNDMDFYSIASEFLCKKHISSSSVGVCADCLKDRLIKLVCSDCGEQRLSSCSCSEISSNRNSCTLEVGSVGRVSFLIENERNGVSLLGLMKPKIKKREEVVLLERSSSSCVEIKKSGFWRIGKFFRKKREKGSGFDEKSDICMVDYMGVSRSRSLCSFRGGGFLGSEDGGDMVVSGGRSSISGARTSSVNGGLVCDSARRSGFSETEPRKSGFESDHRECGNYESDHNGFSLANRRVFSLKESDFNGTDESGFIDFKLDFTSETKPEYSVPKTGIGAGGGLGLGALSNPNSSFRSTRGFDTAAAAAHECSRGLSNGGGGSCRITVSDRGIKKGRKSLKALKWLFKHSPNWANATPRKKEEDLISQA